MSNKKASKNIWLVIMGVLILLQLLSSIISVISYQDIVGYSKIVSLIFIALYGFWLYKKPHGNMLKYAMLIAAATQMIRYSQCVKLGYWKGDFAIVQLISAGILIYVSGRLNRIERNKYLLGFVVVADIICEIWLISISKTVAPIVLFSYLYTAISALTLMIAYFVRFKEHKEAGLMDAPKEK